MTNQGDNNTGSSSIDTILDKAMAMADEQRNWYDLSMMALAERCEISANELRQIYPDSNAIANQWFRQAMEQMLSFSPSQVRSLPARERLELIIWRWFDSLARYHLVTAQMLKSKLHPPHIHHWVPMIFDLSQLVQLWRDAAGLHSGGRQRQIEEIVLTTIFVATLKIWCEDESPQQALAHSRLLDLLAKADKTFHFRDSDDNPRN